MNQVDEGPVSMAELMARLKARQESPKFRARPIQPWQEMALDISRYLCGGLLRHNKSRIFKECSPKKGDVHAAKIAFEDMKEYYEKTKDQKYRLPSYFFWMYNFIRKNYENN